MDHLITLPTNWRYLNQFAPSKWAPAPSHERCGPASTAMAAEFADPSRWIPEELEHDLYVKWAGPDEASDTAGTAIEQVKAWLTSVGIGFIDMQSLVDEFTRGSRDPLRLELEHQNDQGVPQIMTVIDMGRLHEWMQDGSNPSLYPWVGHGAGVSHVIFRVGYSDSDGYGCYADPAAPGFCEDSKGHFQPARIPFADIAASGLWHTLAIMPHNVPAPPSGFSFQRGQWPPEQPKIDVASALSTIESMAATITALSAALANVRADLGAK